MAGQVRLKKGLYDLFFRSWKLIFVVDPINRFLPHHYSSELFLQIRDINISGGCESKIKEIKELLLLDKN